jgi:hypothetical protein
MKIYELVDSSRFSYYIFDKVLREHVLLGGLSKVSFLRVHVIFLHATRNNKALRAGIKCISLF